jgi:myo-inositol 2-dehydrogenase/D-chiro-inositol 1-dehydrogenase
MNVKRRDFLLSSAFYPIALSAQSAPRLNTALIGVGNRGSYLLKTILEQPNAKVVAVCDIKRDRLDKAASTAAKDNPRTYSDWRKVLEEKDVQAVFIATPPYLHSEMAIAALKAGKHVYCEKPIGVTAGQVRDLIAAVKAPDRIFVPGQQLRSLKSLQTAIQKIHDGVIGDVMMIDAQRHAPADIAHDGSSGDWYFDVSKSGGYLVEQSVHNLDLCNWVMGSHPTRAAGFGAILRYKNDPPGRTAFDCGTLSYDYPKSLKLSFTQNVFHPPGLPTPGQYIHVFGTKGAVDLLAPEATMYPLAAGGQPTVLSTKAEDQQDAHIAGFYASILNGAKPPADIIIGATAALTAILGNEAMFKGQVVSWNDLGVDV